MVNNMKTKASESVSQRKARVAGTGNGATLRTRVVQMKLKYSRKEKHKVHRESDGFRFFETVISYI